MDRREEIERHIPFAKLFLRVSTLATSPVTIENPKTSRAEDCHVPLGPLYRRIISLDYYPMWLRHIVWLTADCQQPQSMVTLPPCQRCNGAASDSVLGQGSSLAFPGYALPLAAIAPCLHSLFPIPFWCGVGAKTAPSCHYHTILGWMVQAVPRSRETSLDKSCLTHDT